MLMGTLHIFRKMDVMSFGLSCEDALYRDEWRLRVCLTHARLSPAVNAEFGTSYK